MILVQKKQHNKILMHADNMKVIRIIDGSNSIIIRHIIQTLVKWRELIIVKKNMEANRITKLTLGKNEGLCNFFFFFYSSIL